MTASHPDVSVVIAAFDAESTIAEAVDSALAQRGVSLEVIVVDDSSRDRTAAIAAGFSDDRVKVLVLPENRGPGGARNAGFAVARGRWIAVLDADDALFPGRLAAMIARGDAEHAEIIVDNLQVDRAGSLAGEAMFDQSLMERIGAIDLAAFIAANRLFESTFSFGYLKPIFRASFLDAHRLRYDETLRIGEDYVFLASALARGARCVVEPKAGYLYRVRDGSISHVLAVRHVEAMLAADRTFLCDHELDASARQAQARRTRSLLRAVSFLTLVEHLKSRAPLRALAVALRDPFALWHLRMPIGVRLKRLSLLCDAAWRRAAPILTPTGARDGRRAAPPADRQSR